MDFALTGSSNGLQLNARLYDVAPDGSAALVDRGPRRVTAAEAAAGTLRTDLHGNGWRFDAGHRIRIELAQDDTPFVRATDEPSSLELSRVSLAIPVREASSTIGGGADEKPACGNPISGTNKRNRLKGTECGDQIDGLRRQGSPQGRPRRRLPQGRQGQRPARWRPRCRQAPRRQGQRPHRGARRRSRSRQLRARQARSRQGRSQGPGAKELRAGQAAQRSSRLTRARSRAFNGHGPYRRDLESE